MTKDVEYLIMYCIRLSYSGVVVKSLQIFCPFFKQVVCSLMNSLYTSVKYQLAIYVNVDLLLVSVLLLINLFISVPTVGIYSFN